MVVLPSRARSRQRARRLRHRQAVDVEVPAPDGQREINSCTCRWPPDQAITWPPRTSSTASTSRRSASRWTLPGRYTHDVVPGRRRRARYHIFCAEYCGTKHSGMIGWVKVMEPTEYQELARGRRAEGSMASQGEKLFQQIGAATPATRTTRRAAGRSLIGVYGTHGDACRRSARQGRRQLHPRVDPQSAGEDRKGFQPMMPTFQGQVNEEDLLQAARLCEVDADDRRRRRHSRSAQLAAQPSARPALRRHHSEREAGHDHDNPSRRSLPRAGANPQLPERRLRRSSRGS